MRVDVIPDAARIAGVAAGWIARLAEKAIASRGAFHFAVSGGRTPWAMLEALSTHPLDWPAVHVWQADERVAPDLDPARNFTHIQRSFLDRTPIPTAHIHPMPVDASDLEAAARGYAAALRDEIGDPPVFDLVHLGLGKDGHTASLVPADPVLEVTDRDVATTELYQGHRRMTLTFPSIDRARAVLFVVTGEDKTFALSALRTRDLDVPAARIANPNITVLADRAAAGSG